MAIVNMSKFELITFKQDREGLLDKLQSFEDVHFSVEENESSEEVYLENSDQSVEVAGITEKMTKLNNAINILETYNDKKESKLECSMDELKSNQTSLDEIYQKLMNLVSKRDLTKQEITAYELEAKEFKPWERFDAPIKSIGKKLYTTRIIGQIDSKNKFEFETEIKKRDDVYSEHISDIDRISRYFVLFENESEAEISEFLRSFGFSTINLNGAESPVDEIDILNSKINDKQSELSTIERDIKNILPDLDDFKLRYEYLSNEKLKYESINNFRETKTMNLISGYVPTDKEEEFENVIKNTIGDSYHLDIYPADRDDENVPIQIKNGKLVQPFESLTTMYSLPQYNEIDPTPLLAPFYWFFFGMMAADFGYGVLLTIGCFLGLKIFKLSKPMKENFKFFGLLGISTMIWGVIYSSCFGGLIKLPWEPILDSNDFMRVMIISIAFGVFHILFGLGIKAYMSIRDGNPIDAVYDVLFWYMALLGAIGLLVGNAVPNLIPAIGVGILKWIMIIGMVGIVLFAARDSKSVPGRLIGGIYSLYGITSYVGDFVSYSRLMALGLSGGFIAFAVNTIANMLSESGIVGNIFAFVVLVVFHLFNMFLSFLSGYVHSARLTYVEFFGKFYNGGGKVFNKFRSNPKYIDYN